MAVLAAIALAAAAAAGENLLANPGFESAAHDQPDQWSVYVMPHEGAFARADRAARSGDFAALLHTPTPYAQDPANNWSQNITGDFAGKTLQAGAWIRTEAAGGAAIWVQCWKRNPLRLLHTANSATRDPVRGTQGWREVSMPVEVPEGTAFLTLRCVIQGTGSAWFDDLRLVPTEPPAAKPPADMAPMVPPPGPAPPADAPELRDAVATLDALERQLDSLRDANILLGGALDQVRAENRALLDELRELRTRMEQAGEPGGEPAAEPGAPQADSGRRAPPLVPHGVDWRTLP
jgi:hypothetical protein